MKTIILGVLLSLFGFISLGQELSDKLYHQLFDEIASRNPPKNISQKLDSLMGIETMSTFDSARVYNLKGVYHDLIQESDLAVASLQKAIVLFEGSYKWKTKVQLNLSTAYTSSHQFTKATTMLMEVAKSAKENDDLNLHTKVKEYFANLYFNQGDIKRALNELEQVALSYEELKDTITLSRLYNNLAVLYKKNEAYSKAIEYNVKSLNLSKAMKDSHAVSQSYNNIGLNYERLFYKTDSVPYMQQSIAFFKEAIKIKRQFPEAWNTALYNLIRVYRLIGEYDKANQYSLELSESKRGAYKEVEQMLRDKMLFALNRGHSIEAFHCLFKLDSIQKIIRDLQTHDFEQMLKNQSDLFESKRSEKEKALALTEEHNLRLIVENKHNRLQIIFLSILVIILMGLFGFVFYHKSIIHKNEQEKKDLKLTILRSQMNPHFIFNVLTAIQNSLLDDDPLKTAGYIARFSNLVRKNFDFTDKESIPLNDDIDALVNYIETQKIRFGSKFDYQIEIDQSIIKDEVYIPPMLMQPLVENAIEHGLKKCKHKGQLEVKVQQKGRQLFFCVTDNGVGYAPKPTDGKKHALDVLRARLHLLGYGDEKTFVIQRKGVDGGTEVKFSLTLKKDV
ncbi:histidine kinase [Halosquirtibacter xylanolyticus]|uniref:tetratricopeptide repeat-containing sensor histidine kinase n=1 Tax=Halosquirtibacter xylanolyticus TaxID=3374599 RepID=UPI0037487C2E|nr:histidine kinase [Prolixibacteraceae bacterium]